MILTDVTAIIHTCSINYAASFSQKSQKGHRVLMLTVITFILPVKFFQVHPTSRTVLGFLEWKVSTSPLFRWYMLLLAIF